MFCVWLFFCSSRRKHNDTVVTFSTLKSLGTHFQREKLLISNPGSLYNCSDLKVSNKHVKIMWGEDSALYSHSPTISIIASWLWSSTHYVWFSQFWSHFRGTNALFASKAKINVVWNFFEWRVPKGYPECRNNFKQCWF